MRAIVLAIACLLAATYGQASSPLDSPPKPLSCEVEYPESLHGLNESGSVTVSLVVKPDGTTTRIKVLEASHPALAKAAIAAVEKWTFEPAKKDGEAVYSRLNQEIKYDASKWLHSKEKSNIRFKDFLKKQNEAIKGARRPANLKSLTLQRDLNLRFERGLLTTTYSVELPQGEYHPVVETDEGTFYLALSDGFRYENLRLGGVYRPKNGERDLVWYMHHVLEEKMRAKLLSGKQIKKMRAGLLNLANRPTIEPDFQIPQNAFKP